MAWPGSSKAKYSGKNAKANAKAACESDSKCKGISCKVVIVVSVGIFQYTGCSCQVRSEVYVCVMWSGVCATRFGGQYCMAS